MSLDWPGMMRAGLTRLRLRPAEFWALTPAELMLMLGLGAGVRPMARARLEELARAFPDRPRGEERQDGEP
ncbi:rcc01693 family protein [Wenxinia marina]|uniref:Phage tail assembly chaperone n=1 Tax=Wenxinia marina DSM 24838 TaxID=1123501 RepID=A0A0D0QC87_9RHOB|nr:rcc01693 family protein [Wenxinia marina]KIQ69932.1 phage conserved hypothetical protein [Wenxinia marina DSM 24838]GGL62262.1 phage tail assembly chaperone [Wenxinia marina]